jgi:single-stranded-DNA-specific exonuclease
LNQSRWNLLPPAPVEYVCRLKKEAGYSELVAQLFYNRGLKDPEQIAFFLDGAAPVSADPFLLPDMHQAVSRIYRALLSGEKIAVCFRG